jgi:hypothetical protein
VLAIFFFSCFDYHLIILFGYRLFFRVSFSVLVDVLQQNFIVARKCTRHTLIQGNFKYWGNIVPSMVRQAPFTHDPGDSRSLNILHVIHAASRAPWKSGLQSISPGIQAAEFGNLDCNPDYNPGLQSGLLGLQSKKQSTLPASYSTIQVSYEGFRVEPSQKYNYRVGRNLALSLF